MEKDGIAWIGMDWDEMGWDGRGITWNNITINEFYLNSTLQFVTSPYAILGGEEWHLARRNGHCDGLRHHEGLDSGGCEGYSPCFC